MPLVLAVVPPPGAPPEVPLSLLYKGAHMASRDLTSLNCLSVLPRSIAAPIGELSRRLTLDPRTNRTLSPTRRRQRVDHPAAGHMRFDSFPGKVGASMRCRPRRKSELSPRETSQKSSVIVLVGTAEVTALMSEVTAPISGASCLNFLGVDSTLYQSHQLTFIVN